MPNNFYEAIERCKARGAHDVAKRIEMERKMVSALVRHALSNGMTVSVNDGDEWTLLKCNSYATIFEALNTTDHDFVELNDGETGKRLGRFMLIYGNDGYDVIADYTVNDICDSIWENVISPLADRLERGE